MRINISIDVIGSRTLTSLESFRQSFAFSGDEKEHDSPVAAAPSLWDDLPLVCDPSERPTSNNYVTFSAATIDNNNSNINSSSVMSNNTMIHVDMEAGERAVRALAPPTSTTPLTVTAHRSYQQLPASTTTFRQGSLTLSMPGPISITSLATPPVHTPSLSHSATNSTLTPLNTQSLSHPNTPVSASSDYVISKKRIMNALLELGFNEVNQQCHTIIS